MYTESSENLNYFTWMKNDARSRARLERNFMASAERRGERETASLHRGNMFRFAQSAAEWTNTIVVAKRNSTQEEINLKKAA